MESTFWLRALDVFEAARLTHNAIMARRRELEDEAVARWRNGTGGLFARAVRRVLGAETEDEYREFVKQRKDVKVFVGQADKCRALVNLADGVMRAAMMTNSDPKKAGMGITLEHMSTIEVGWEKMMEAWRDERAKFDETKSDLPMPTFVKDTDEEKIIEFDGIRYKSTDAPNWKTWVPEPLL